jgi:protein TonB
VFSEFAAPGLEKDLLARIRVISFAQQNVTQTLLDYSFNFLLF